MTYEQILILLYGVLYFFVFLTGICIGSFLNVVIYRLPLQISFAKGRSFCPNCKETLRSYDMIPLFSFLFLKGKCRFCKEKIPPRYPIIEGLTGLLFVWICCRFGFTIEAVAGCMLVALLVALTAIDFDTMTIPNGLILAMIVPAVLFVFWGNDISWLSRVIGFFILSVPMLVLNFFITDCFGGGDIKLIAVCGVILGWQNTLLAGIISLFIGGIAAVYLLATKKKDHKAHMPFGPFLSFGIFIALLYGESIIGGYLSLFGLSY